MSNADYGIKSGKPHPLLLIVHPSSFVISRRAYTFVEMLITLGVLAIVLGMMMNLANRVRREATDLLPAKS